LFKRGGLCIKPTRTQRRDRMLQRADGAPWPPGGDELLHGLPRIKRRLVCMAGFQESVSGLLGQVSRAERMVIFARAVSQRAEQLARLDVTAIGKQPDRLPHSRAYHAPAQAS
jgi:hypothetical protein